MIPGEIEPSSILIFEDYYYCASCWYIASGVAELNLKEIYGNLFSDSKDLKTGITGLADNVILIRMLANDISLLKEQFEILYHSTF